MNTSFFGIQDASYIRCEVNINYNEFNMICILHARLYIQSNENTIYNVLIIFFTLLFNSFEFWDELMDLLLVKK